MSYYTIKTNREGEITEHFIVPRSGDKDLIFVGEELAGSTTWEASQDRSVKWEEVTIYRTLGGNYVIASHTRNRKYDQDQYFSAEIFKGFSELKAYIEEDVDLTRHFKIALMYAAKRDKRFIELITEDVDSILADNESEPKEEAA